MDTFFGIPAHPLFVHLPVVLVPLAFVGAVLMVVRSTWWERLVWPTVVMAILGTLGAVLAASSGESLEEAVEDRAVRSLLHEHTEAGELARTASLFFLAVVLAIVFLPRMVARVRAAAWWKPLTVVAVVLSGTFASWSMYDAGHSGAKSVWHDVTIDGGAEEVGAG